LFVVGGGGGGAAATASFAVPIHNDGPTETDTRTEHLILTLKLQRAVAPTRLPVEEKTPVHAGLAGCRGLGG